MNCILIGWFHYRYSHIRLPLGVLKSSNKNVTMVFLLSVLPSFCIRGSAHLWNILHEICIINILHATCLQPSAHQGNIFHAVCRVLSIWINEKHDNNVRSCASFPRTMQLISFMKYISWNIFFFHSVRYSIEIYWFVTTYKYFILHATCFKQFISLMCAAPWGGHPPTF